MLDDRIFYIYLLWIRAGDTWVEWIAVSCGLDSVASEHIKRSAAFLAERACLLDQVMQLAEAAHTHGVWVVLDNP